MKLLHRLLLTATACCLFLSGVIFFSCSEPQEVVSDPLKLIEPRSGDGLWADSIFELHNEYILWLFDNYMDSAKYYAHYPVDFMKFASRMSLEFNGESFNYSDILDHDTLILASPYYIKNQGFTYQAIYNGWSVAEKNALHSALDSVETALENSAPEYKLQALINNGKIRASSLNTSNEDVVVNCLTQASYSIALAYELEDLYGDTGSPATSFSIICLIRGIRADICTIGLMNSKVIGAAFSGYTPSEKANLVKEISMHAFSICFVDCG